MKLRNAVESGDISLVKSLLEKIKLPDTQESHDLLKTALQKIGSKDHSEICRILIERGAPTVGYEKNGEDSLLHLVLRWHLESSGESVMVTDLLEFLAFSDNVNLIVFNEKKETPLHLTMKCKDILHRFRDVLLNELFENPEMLENIVDEDGLSLFHIVCTSPNSKYVELFVDKVPTVNVKDAVPSSSDCFPGYSAIHFAAAYHRHDTLKLLIDHGADLNVTTAEGSTPLHLVCVSSEYDWISREAAKGIPEEMNIWPTQYFERLKVALEARISMIEMLLEMGADVDAKDEAGRTALMLVATKTKSDAISCSSAIPNAFYNFPEEVSNMCRRECDLLRKHHDSIVNILFDYYKRTRNMDPVQVLNKKSDSGGRSILHYLAEQKDSLIYVTRLMFSFNSDLNIADDDLLTPTHIAVKNRNKYILDELLGAEKYNLEELANVNLQDKLGNTPLHCNLIKDKVVDNYELFILISLLEYGADLHVENEVGYPGYWFALRILIELLSDDVSFPAVSRYEDVINLKVKNGDRLFQAEPSRAHLRSLKFNTVLPVVISIWKILFAWKIIRYNYNDPVLGNNFNYVTQKLILTQQSYEAALTFQGECIEELNKLNRSYMNKSVTLYDLLVKNINRVASYTENVQMNDFLVSASLTKDYPIYGTILRSRFMSGLVRKKYLDDALASLKLLIQRDIPLFCLDMILGFLSDKKLRDIIEAAKAIERCQPSVCKSETKTSPKRLC